jgi:hypothetical protein
LNTSPAAFRLRIPTRPPPSSRQRAGGGDPKPSQRWPVITYRANESWSEHGRRNSGKGAVSGHCRGGIKAHHLELGLCTTPRPARPRQPVAIPRAQRGQRHARHRSSAPRSYQRRSRGRSARAAAGPGTPAESPRPHAPAGWSRRAGDRGRAVRQLLVRLARRAGRRPGMLCSNQALRPAGNAAAEGPDPFFAAFSSTWRSVNSWKNRSPMG